MAGKFVTLVFDSVHDVGLRGKMVLLALADHANGDGDGVAYPSQATLSRRTGIGERRIRDQLKLLEEAGWIQKSGKVKGRRGMLQCYQLKVDRMKQTLDAAKAAPGSRQSHANGARKGGTRLPHVSGANPALLGSTTGVFDATTGAFGPDYRHPGADEHLNRNYRTGFEQPPKSEGERPTDAAPEVKTVLKKLIQGEPEEASRLAEKTSDQLEQEKQRQVRAAAEWTRAQALARQGE